MKVTGMARMRLGVLIAAAVTVWLAGSPASAAPYVVAYHGVDYGMADSGSDTAMWACDGENDFHTMWAEVQTTRFVNRVVFDAIADGNCVSSSWSSSQGGYITYIRACEEGEGCSPWKFVP
jgi:hypothetical protein